MKAGRSRRMLQHWLMFVIACVVSTAGIAVAAAPVSQVPTGPKNINGQWASPDYYTTANWANSPPLAKFVDTLPGLTAANKNNLDQYLPVAVADTTTYPGSDYYIIKLVEYFEQMHSDLPGPKNINPEPGKGTKLRGYVQLNEDGSYKDSPHYLGPIILAQRDRPVRIKFINGLANGTDGDLFIPVDSSVMGAGKGPQTPDGQPCDNTADGNVCASYTQNRADIHLHGGRTPWISDGTPHQWITPAGENTPFTKGVSMQNVPDMPDPGPGATTYYFTNQQSARLMFYHDHAFGITRLNVYAGEAAGYLITDKFEQDLVDSGILPDQIPLIIQDKTFVNAALTTKYIYNPATGLFDTPISVPSVRSTDPLWNWGSASPSTDPDPALNGIRPPVTGDLWLPHVYMPAQQPTGSNTGGVNPFGRWMYGPWFYPATNVVHGPVTNPYYDTNCSSPDPFLLAQCETPGQPPLVPGTPDVSMGMEAFQDSVVVNGTAFPSLTVEPRAYRFRILNAAGDRFWNLSFYIADPAQVSPDPRLLATGKSNLTEVKMVSAPAAGDTWPPSWPVDGRDGGVPDPAFRGPSFLQIGTEGGFLPSPVVIEPQPITYVTDPTAFWVGNVDKMGLALGPAERADVIVDFTNYANKTLILYNDAPAAWPARVASYDYYTDAPDLRDSGGYGTGGTWDPITGSWQNGRGPLVGYAPNTRTVMQVIVKGSGAGNSYTQAALEKEFTAAALPSTVNPSPVKTLFERSQEPIIVGQPSYSSAYPNSYFPANAPWEGVNQINDQFLQFVTVAGEQVKVPTEPKGIHDEMGASFDPEFGRMSGNLGMQLPNPTTLNALLVLYGFSDMPTEDVKNSIGVNVEVLPGLNGLPGTVADGTQIWKISHNGVDTHPIHFHIFDVQLINRVGWDGQLLMPEPNELGWKDTVKISPLEDTIVAVRPRAPALPFGIPNSIRPLNPAIPIDSTMGFAPLPLNGSAWPFFSSIDWTTGQAYRANNPVYPYPNYKGVVTNVLYDFGWEYVWHCHILSHEEMDMMRPIVLKYEAMAPPAFPAAATVNNTAVDVSWNDPTPVNYTTVPEGIVASDPETYRNPANEIGFNIYRSTDGGTSFNKLNDAILPANSSSYTDPSLVAGAIYQVEAFNAGGSTFSSSARPIAVVVEATTAPFTSPGPVNLTATITNIPAGVTITQVAFYNGATLIGTDLDAMAPYTFTWTNVAQGAYSITAKATDSQGVVTVSPPIDVTVSGGLTADFTVTGSANNGTDIGYCESITFASTSTGTVTGYGWTINGQSYLTQDVTVTLPVGTYAVTLAVVNSADGQTDQITKTVTVVNHNPVAIPGGPYFVLSGGNLVLNGSGTDPDTCVVSPLTYAWNVDNKGPYDFFTANPTISYDTLYKVLGVGTHTMTLKVTDAQGATGLATATVSVPQLPSTFLVTFAPAAGGTVSGTAYQQVVPSASTTPVTAVPNTAASYHFVNWTGTGGFVASTSNPLTVANVTSDMLITANFALDQFTVTFAADAHGSITGTTPQTVDFGTSPTAVTAVPAVGYHFVNWTNNATGAIVGTTPTLTLSNIRANMAVTANFDNTLKVNFFKNGNGSVTGPLNQVVVYGANATQVQAVPAADSDFVNWTGTGGFVTTASNPLDVTNVTADMNITANFAIKTFAVNFSANPGGTVAPAQSLSQTVNYGGSTATVTAVANQGFNFLNWTDANGIVVGTNASLTVNTVTAGSNISANFSTINYTVTTSGTGAGGSITPTAPVAYGSNFTVTVTPNLNYHITQVLIDGVPSQPVIDPKAAFSYTFTNVTANHTVSAVFDADSMNVTMGYGVTGPATIPYGGSASYAIVPPTGYIVLDVLVNNVSVGAVTDYTVTNAVTDQTILATLTLQTFNISLSQCISGPSTAIYGSLPTYLFSPPGFQVVDVRINGVSVGAVPSYTFQAGISANQNITASFSPISTAAAPVRLVHAAGGSQDVNTLQQAYNAAADGDTILLQAGSLSGSLLAGRAIKVTIKGGYEATYTTACNPTRIQGTIRVKAGTIRSQNVYIK